MMKKAFSLSYFTLKIYIGSECSEPLGAYSTCPLRRRSGGIIIENRKPQLM